MAIVAARERLTEALRQLGYGSATSATSSSPTAIDHYSLR